MKYIFSLLTRPIPILVMALILAAFFADYRIIFGEFLWSLLAVVVFLLAYKLVKLIIKNVSYHLFTKKTVREASAKGLKLLNFPNPKEYYFDYDDSISGELYFRYVSEDASLETDVRLAATEYRSAIETLRALNDFTNLFLMLRILKDSVGEYEKGFDKKDDDK